MGSRVGRLLLTPVTSEHLAFLATHLRDADVQELRASQGDSLCMLAILQQSVTVSAECWVATTQAGEAVAVFGVAPIPQAAGYAAPWMLGTDTLARHGKDIVQLGKRFAERWGAEYDRLINFVDTRNIKSIAWLRHSGYSVRPAQPHGVNGELFHLFERCA